MRIKELRESCGITQLNLSKKMQINQSTVAKWETTDARPRAEKLPELAKILGCSIDDLFEREEIKDQI